MALSSNSQARQLNSTLGMQNVDPSEARVYTLPPDPGVGQRLPTGLVCPDCHGTLSIQAAGPRRHILFICRIGHSYDLAGLLAAKDEDVENRAWAAVLGYEEMAALFRDLIDYGYVDERSAAQYRDLLQAAQVNARQFRDAIERDRPIRLPNREAGTAANPG